ncbi:MAG: indolepyruvate oxidoreductase [Candidatus Aminicenantes bacterium RBG_13_62_12]|jgi:indolepyruvate ferredoxin oxidoreductase beta subunit|nr:MAG: indolepyruvate oxidoreductase [Candidatus Aminicenantes bacterium RBG_13_62_12]
MKQDIILAGVGGQGIISIAYVIASAALEEGLDVKQAEVHGMSQRGGAVQSHLRLSQGRIWSDLIPQGEADLVLSVEPLEALRYLDYLRPDGMVIASRAPFVNIKNYPDLETVLTKIREIPRHLIIDSEKLAKEAGSSRTQNMVLLGAAAGRLMVKEESLIRFIKALFERHGENIVSANLKAFALGQAVAAAADFVPMSGGSGEKGSR